MDRQNLKYGVVAVTGIFLFLFFCFYCLFVFVFFLFVFLVFPFNSLCKAQSLQTSLSQATQNFSHRESTRLLRHYCFFALLKPCCHHYIPFVCYDPRPPKQSHEPLRGDLGPSLPLFFQSELCFTDMYQ